MKKSLIIAMLLPALLSASAQQALWGVPTIISPEVNQDKTVTFRLEILERAVGIHDSRASRTGTLQLYICSRFTQDD